MSPGNYLEKRRLMAGYSLTSLARELLLLTGFGSSRAESDFRRLRMTLISAEQGSLHHGRDRIELIRAFVPLDTGLYLHLVECERSGDPYRVEGLCRLCACSFHDACVLHVGPTAALGSSVCDTAKNDGGDTDLCSACEESLARLTPERPASSSKAVGRQEPTVAQQLRALGEQMARINVRQPQSEQSFLRVVPSADRPLPLTQALLRPIPNTGES